jgi:hypothetical protein
MPLDAPKCCSELLRRHTAPAEKMNGAIHPQMCCNKPTLPFTPDPPQSSTVRKQTRESPGRTPPA